MTAQHKRRTARKAAPKRKTTSKTNARNTVKKAGGRPNKLTADEATIRTLRGLGKIQCTEPEGAAVLGVAIETFRKFLVDNTKAYDAFHHIGKGTGLISLRRKMWQKATEGQGSVAMMIWLSKQHLAMRETLEQKIETTNTHTGKIEHVTSEDVAKAPTADAALRAFETMRKNLATQTPFGNA